MILYSCQSKVKVYYVNSYDIGYSTSDRVEKIIVDYCNKNNIEIKLAHLNSKRIKDENHLLNLADSIVLDIQQFKPNYLLTSDDAAITYIVEPFFYNSKIPVLYCGVNWSKEAYQLNDSIEKGMLEVLPLRACIDTITHYFSAIHKIGILSENSLSEQNNTRLLDTLYRHAGLEPEYSLVSNFEKWKESFLELNSSCDLLYLPSNGAIQNWSKEEAIQFIDQNMKIPIITCDDFMMPYAVFGMTKVVEEQGEWLIQNLSRLIDGNSITQVENTQNNRASFYWSPSLADAINFHPGVSLRKALNEYKE